MPIMHKQPAPLRSEEGFVLVTGLLILMILTLLGLAATTNTTIELQIAGNDRLHKQTLYEAEAGAILGTEVLEQNFNCAIGFAPTGGNPWADLEGTIRAFERNTDRDPSEPPDSNSIAFWRNVDLNGLEKDDWPASGGFYIGDTAEADVAYNYNGVANVDPDNDGDPSDAPPDTGYLYIAGETQMLPGGALQMAAGYEGKGKGAGGGGVAKIMDIYSHYRGALDSESIILFGWRHLTGTEGNCVY